MHSLALICDTHRSPTFFLSNKPDSKGGSTSPCQPTNGDCPKAIKQTNQLCHKVKSTDSHHYTTFVHWGRIATHPRKTIVRCIKDGHCIDMAELLSDNLEAANAIDDDQSKAASHKQQDVTHIMYWIQCFSTYIAGMSFRPYSILEFNNQ